MISSRHYFDHNATQPLCREARDEMFRVMDFFGNPSSVHMEGRAARSIIEDARSKVATLVNAHPREIVFTSGATEANAMVFLARQWGGLLVGNSEHLSVLAPAKRSSVPRYDIPTSSDGLLCIDAALEWLQSSCHNKGPYLASLGLANGETGVLQPVERFLHSVNQEEVWVHSDAAQVAGRVPIDFNALSLSMMSLSAHKMGGPKGVGALVIRDGLNFDPLIVGGGQEQSRRAGTENVIAIAGFGAAASAALCGLEYINKIRSLRDKLETELKRITPQSVIFGRNAPRLPNTLLIAAPGKDAETLVIKFDLLGVAVSAGAACSSGRVTQSHVLKSMGIDQELARSAIRISLGPSNTEEEIMRFVALWSEVIDNKAIAA
ncbi:MAG: cysteine desulfurase family protein [Hyphomicrobium sp.]